MKEYYVYILECADGSFYTGHTSNLDQRIIEHNSGKYNSAYTFSRRPVILRWFEAFTDPTQANIVERQIKGWSKRKKKALIEGNWKDLKDYSKNYTRHGRASEE